MNPRPSPRTTPEIWPGSPYPLGANWDGSGTTFAVFSEHAEAIELCLFGPDDDTAADEVRYELPEITAYVHHGYVPGIAPGQRYGFRAHGPWDPKRAMRFNPNKLLLDPYAKAIDGAVRFERAVYDHRPDDHDTLDPTDSAPFVPRSIVINPFFDWGTDRRPKRPRRDTLIYEAHVKGLTARHPSIPEELRGTYAGVARPEIIEYLQSLGVTALELLPVHQFVPEQFLVDRGLSNYWGYSSIGYLAPHNSYSAWGTKGEQVQEFKHMVRALHDGGIEVIVDVVYNHTSEGNALGPTFCHKGLDNASYYRTDPSDGRRYIDFSGTGNTLNVDHPNVLQLIMDSLRYWVDEMHVDGFRFDLASALGRDGGHVEDTAAFFDIIHQDPALRQVKLIAEPWDVGEGGYQVGRFPPLWSEWNGRYRDTVREFWKGDPGVLGTFASSFTGSSDLYEHTGRRPSASINFVTAHDGFTLHDLVAYNERHNEANTEENRDGERHNRSWNSGVEGPTDNASVNHIRALRTRAILATVLLSQGVPMLLGGDEMGRTQHGNNNAYCQDNEISWFDWESMDDELVAFTRRLVDLRRNHPVFRRRRFFSGDVRSDSLLDGGPPTDGLPDIMWFAPDGTLMTDTVWNDPRAHALSVYLNGSGLTQRTSRGEWISGESFVVVFNGHGDPETMTVPLALGDRAWHVQIDTAQLIDAADLQSSAETKPVEVIGQFVVDPWSVVVLRESDHS